MKIAMQEYVSVAIRPTYFYGAIDMYNASSNSYEYWYFMGLGAKKAVETIMV